MAKKPYNVAERFQEVARRAQETGPIHTGPKKKKVEPAAPVDTEAYSTRPGKTSGSDVNLPLKTATPEARTRAVQSMMKFGRRR